MYQLEHSELNDYQYICTWWDIFISARYLVRLNKIGPIRIISMCICILFKQFMCYFKIYKQNKTLLYVAYLSGQRKINVKSIWSKYIPDGITWWGIICTFPSHIVLNERKLSAVQLTWGVCTEAMMKASEKNSREPDTTTLALLRACSAATNSMFWPAWPK